MRLLLAIASLVVSAPLFAQANGSAPASTTSDPEPIIVARTSGLVEIASDGTVLRTLTRTPAATPRWMPGGREIVYLSYGSRGPFAVDRIFEMRRIGRDGTDERRIVKMPSPHCGGLMLNIQDPNDFVVDRNGGFACIQFQDSNFNMMTVSISVRVDLRTGRVERRRYQPDDKNACGIPGGERFDCTPAHGWESDPDVEVRAPQGFEPRLPSPSGQWIILRGNGSQGDYIHADAFLFDTKKRRAYPIRKGSWPTPLANLTHREGQTADIVGESDIRWIGETLLLGDLLVRPGIGAVKFDGEVIR